jgi:hypothetical protein
MPEMVSNILDTVQDTFRHLTNGDFSILVLLAIAVVVIGVLIFRR